MQLHAPALFISAVALAIPALAQSGTVRVLADNQSSITIAPGTPTHLMLIAESPIPGLQLARLSGDLLITANAGTPADFSTPLTGPGALVSPGSFLGGSRVAMDFASQPPFFGPSPPAWSATPIHVFSYDLTLESPGTYTAIWQSPTSHPNAIWHGLPVGPLYSPTEYVLATITVTPAPWSLALLAFAPLAARRRPSTRQPRSVPRR